MRGCAAEGSRELRCICIRSLNANSLCLRRGTLANTATQHTSHRCPPQLCTGSGISWYEISQAKSARSMRELIRAAYTPSRGHVNRSKEADPTMSVYTSDAGHSAAQWIRARANLTRLAVGTDPNGFRDSSTSIQRDSVDRYPLGSHGIRPADNSKRHP
ncbi:uncharacterized protein L969DRAFT_53378 [Mixia osmundae IAM 14324]|uniref:Uncharacterized protein n=1 Tax=Mixia osmundae (strain CBS 9802 / IAM 14324 / JCM 22182 / KY 12970) TaxID=764103 RepID=G7DUX0_MIXOS|nr:uncharacterized protein L969DRAFT_53378 [Mixia osmundae IAM 14324]KEI37403.1 hypothetical protein L969DRAFT_53378 [Mixia osmundae IAM 14324]GAA94380.1 hypothetical protein E5Q_01031 [Mixia osmundae IAM 14324]